KILSEEIKNNDKVTLLTDKTHYSILNYDFDNVLLVGNINYMGFDLFKSLSERVDNLYLLVPNHHFILEKLESLTSNSNAVIDYLTIKYLFDNLCYTNINYVFFSVNLLSNFPFFDTNIDTNILSYGVMLDNIPYIDSVLKPNPSKNNIDRNLLDNIVFEDMNYDISFSENINIFNTSQSYDLLYSYLIKLYYNSTESELNFKETNIARFLNNLVKSKEYGDNYYRNLLKLNSLMMKNLYITKNVILNINKTLNFYNLINFSDKGDVISFKLEKL
ncbi:MAG: hypothetical protein ACPLX8_02410, partial [Nanopusillaceae archaeon]